MAGNEQLVKFALAYPRPFGLILAVIGAALAGYFLIWPAMQMEQQVAHVEYSAPFGAIGGYMVLMGLLILVLGDRIIDVAVMESSDRIARYGQTRVYIGYAVMFIAFIAFYIYCDMYIAAHGYTETH
ncbi:MAG: hypothetical protein JST90_12330 [Bacteroidetes bacterium]|nr:hypothetical protein [Bacteroidota bacterium]